MNEQQYDHNYCLTDFKNKYYLLSDSVNWTATPLDSFDNLTQGVLSIISQLGYVNDEWKIHSEGVPKSIEFIITPKDVPPELLEESKYSLYFIPMDNYSYKLDSI